MIVVDHWVIRRPSGFTMISPIETRERSKELFARSLPPRLAKAQDQTGSRGSTVTPRARRWADSASRRCPRGRDE
jgi:hypothetical protein